MAWAFPTLLWREIPTGAVFYFGDTIANVIWSYDYDPLEGTISNETQFFQDFERGLPDGSTVDTEGYLWNCQFYSGWWEPAASPPDGVVDSVIEMP